MVTRVVRYNMASASADAAAQVHINRTWTKSDRAIEWLTPRPTLTCMCAQRKAKIVEQQVRWGTGKHVCVLWHSELGAWLLAVSPTIFFEIRMVRGSHF